MTISSVLMTATLMSLTANPIDAILQRTWQQEGLTPAPVCSDEQFLRRVSLDLIGRIPTVQELHRFRKDPDRTALVDSLLDSPEFAEFQADVWTQALAGYGNELREEVSRTVLRDWLADQIRQDVPWNRIARDLIAAEGQSAFDGPVNFLLANIDEPVVRISRVFLGVRLDCARCHDHPFDRWTQDDYERMTRFFETLELDEMSAGNVRVRSVPGYADEDDGPVFLTGARPRTTRWRDEFALFTTRSRPFARAFVNRLWYQLFGRGIVHPADDFHAGNPPASRELLEFLADEARSSGFRLKHMLRLICRSRAYQFQAGPHSDHDRAVERFAVRILKPLTPEQYVRSLSTVIGTPLEDEDREQLLDMFLSDRGDDLFTELWEDTTTMQQLMMQLSADIPRVPDRTTADLFERILSRRPTRREQRLCADRRRSDILFALMNSDEFRFSP